MAVGFRTGLSFDGTRPNWDGTGDRPLAWSVWYPAADHKTALPPEERSWFKLRPVARDAELQSSDRPRPLMLLSHGSGASALAMDWLGHRLAERGFVALGLDHHGHTASEPYRAEGFLCLWERARDFSALMDDRSWRHALGGPVADHAGIAGFSAGACAAMLLVGARVAFSQFEPDNPVRSPTPGPREFPNLADELPRLHANPVFRTSWERRRDDYTDKRIRCAVAIAPGRSMLGFSSESLRRIRPPVRIVGGDADTVAPPAECCRYLYENMAGSALEILDGVGHYTFLPEGTDTGRQAALDLFDDAEGVRRSAVHDHVASLIAEFCRTIG